MTAQSVLMRPQGLHPRTRAPLAPVATSLLIFTHVAYSWGDATGS